MNALPKNIHLIVLAITALTLSRTLFFFFDDPEGPNLLIVIFGGAVIYIISLIGIAFKLWKLIAAKKLFLAILIQIVVAVIMCLYLK